MAKEKLYCFNCCTQQPSELPTHCGGCSKKLVAGTQQEVQHPRTPTSADRKAYQLWLEGLGPSLLT